MESINTKTAWKMVKAFAFFFDRHFFSFANANKHFTFKQVFVRHGSKQARTQSPKTLMPMRQNKKLFYKMKFWFPILILSIFLPNEIFGQIINTVPCASPNYASYVTLDSIGNIFICQPLNNKVIKFEKNTCNTSTIVGTGNWGYVGDGGPATSANLSTPMDITFDRSGNLYIADQCNHVIRKVNLSTNIISTVAGNGFNAQSDPQNCIPGGFSGDGGLATFAKLSLPVDVEFDNQENMYIVDRGNNRIRKVDHNTGIISTVAGNGLQGFNGDSILATAATLSQPISVAIDSTGNIYIGDEINYRIRKVDKASGMIYTITGNGSSSFSGDGGQAINATLSDPRGITIDNFGCIYFTDIWNNRIRKIDTTGQGCQTNLDMVVMVDWLQVQIFLTPKICF
jgi:hypothetical protein